ncbi:hypothetical protein GCM10010464_19650 [Pseudonocardia yunnanensis]
MGEWAWGNMLCPIEFAAVARTLDSRLSTLDSRLSTLDSLIVCKIRSGEWQVCNGDMLNSVVRVSLSVSIIL